MRDDSIRKRLLVESNLTLESVLRISNSLDAALTENSLMQNRDIKAEKTYNIQVNQTRPAWNREKGHCYRCNDEKHLANT